MKRNLFALLLFTVGCVFIFNAIYQIKLRNSPVTFNTINAPNLTESERVISISIPDLNIYLPVVDVSILKGKWEDPKNNVGHLVGSPLPGEVGNSVFYGHNFPNIFGKLHRVKSGMVVSFDFSSGKTIKLPIKYSYTVTADQTHIVLPTEDSRVTLYTCTGFLDSRRLVVIL